METQETKNKKIETSLQKKKKGLYNSSLAAGFSYYYS